MDQLPGEPFTDSDSDDSDDSMPTEESSEIDEQEDNDNEPRLATSESPEPKVGSSSSSVRAFSIDKKPETSATPLAAEARKGPGASAANKRPLKRNKKRELERQSSIGNVERTKVQAQGRREARKVDPNEFPGSFVL